VFGVPSRRHVFKIRVDVVRLGPIDVVDVHAVRARPNESFRDSVVNENRASI
jgi:hypothetical protein